MASSLHRQRASHEIRENAAHLVAAHDHDEQSGERDGGDDGPTKAYLDQMMTAKSQASPLRVAIYVRQSVAVEEGIEQQIEECTTYAEVVKKATVVQVYPDNATSASAERGPDTQWGRMITDFDAGKFDAVVAVAADRLLRRVVDVVELRKPKRPSDMRILLARDGIDTATSLGSVVLTILVALAEAEIENKKARALPFRDARHALGVPTPGRVPYGYRWIGKAERDERNLGELRYEVVPDEAAVVRFVFRSAFGQVGGKKGIELGSLARDLNAGRATDENGDLLGDHSKTRDGRAWIPSTLRRMLLSPYYAALLPPISSLAERRDRDSGKVRSWSASAVDIDSCIPGMWEPLVSIDTLRAIRHSLLDPSRLTNGGSTSRKWLLSGIARCGAVLSEAPLGGGAGPVEMCGAHVRSAVTREGHRGYRCPSGHFLRRAEVIDAYVVEKVLERLSRPDAISLLRPPVDVDVPELQAHHKALEARLANVLRLVASGRYSYEQGEHASDDLRSELAAVRSQLDAVYAADPLAEAVSVEDVRSYWDGLILGRQRAVLDAVMTPVIEPVGKGRAVTAVNIGATIKAGWKVSVMPETDTEDVPPLSDAARTII